MFARVLCHHWPFVRSVDGNSRQSTEENAYVVTIHINHSMTTLKMASLSYDNVKCRHLVTTFEMSSLSDDIRNVIT